MTALPVYYDARDQAQAAQLRETIIGKFKIESGAFSDEPRGPHPIAQFNVIFENSEFQTIVPWLMLNRDGLDVLVHALTESSYDDHSKNALWLGKPGADAARNPAPAIQRNPAAELATELAACRPHPNSPRKRPQAGEGMGGGDTPAPCFFSRGADSRGRD